MATAISESGLSAGDRPGYAAAATLVPRHRVVPGRCARKVNGLILMISSCCFDLETSSLNANFGIVLCGVIKGSDRKKPYVFRGDEYEPWKQGKRSDDHLLVKDIVACLSQYDVLVAHNGCVTPGHRILTADLRWVPVETLVPGDRLLNFSDLPAPRRNWEVGTVVSNHPFTDDVYRLVLSDGSELVSNGEHPWLVGGQKESACARRWSKTSDMSIYHKRQKQPIVRLLPVWTDPSSYAEGYLAGFLDNFAPDKLPSVKAFSKTSLTVEAIEKVGPHTVCGLQVSNGTYIVEGFGAHNSRFDLPYIRTRMAKWNTSLEWGTFPNKKLVDPVLLARSKLRMSSNGLAAIASLIGAGEKTIVDGDIWVRASLDGDSEAMDHIVKHCIADVNLLEKVADAVKGYSSAFNTYGSGF